MPDTFTDKEGVVLKARRAVHLSVHELAASAEINPQFIEHVESRRAVTDGPALRQLFDALERAATDQANALGAVAKSMAGHADAALARQRQRDAATAAVGKAAAKG